MFGMDIDVLNMALLFTADNVDHNQLNRIVSRDEHDSCLDPRSEVGPEYQ